MWICVGVYTEYAFHRAGQNAVSQQQQPQIWWVLEGCKREVRDVHFSVSSGTAVVQTAVYTLQKCYKVPLWLLLAENTEELKFSKAGVLSIGGRVVNSFLRMRKARKKKLRIPEMVGANEIGNLSCRWQTWLFSILAGCPTLGVCERGAVEKWLQLILIHPI